jgi:glycosyltransferase involved in cell wall biosynthesis
MSKITGALAERIDVILLTKNSLKDCFKAVVDSIYANVPVNRLLVVDGGSTDGTLEFVKQYPNVVIIDDVKGNRATARQKGIEAVETTWHLHVDSDVVLCQDWFKLAHEQLDPNVGALWGVAIPKDKHIYNLAKSMAVLYRKDVPELLLEQRNLKRYLTHDTLIRTELVKDIKIPADLHIWEDHYIGKHIVAKGFRWLTTRQPYSDHYSKDTMTYKDFVNSGKLAREVHSYTNKQILLRIGFAVPKSLWILLTTHDFTAAKRQYDSYVGLAKGWFFS